MPAPDRKRRLTAFLVALAVLIATPLAVVAADAFTDVPDSNVFHDDIAWLADANVTKGCNPPDNTEFCPSDNVTREQMAAFMRRLAENKVVDAATAETADHANTADSATNATTADSATNADTVGEIAPTDLVPGGVLPAGSTVRGTLNVGGTAAAVNAVATDDISYGYDMGAALDVIIINNGDTPPAECPGTAQAPEAEPGYLCIYSTSDTNTELGNNTSYSYGVTVYTRSDGAGDFWVIANWAGTAPDTIPPAAGPSSVTSPNGS